MKMTVSRRSMLLQMALAPAAVAAAQIADIPPTISKVYPGTDGKLVYVPDEQGNTILDFSYAGYGGGGASIPTVPVKVTVWPVAGDNTENIQAAIDKVSALPMDQSGFRGAVLIKMGYYRMATPVRIQASGVVLRGEGMGDTGTILIGTGTGRSSAGAGGPGGGQPTLVRIAGASGVATMDETKQAVTDDYVPVGARSFRVASARDFKPGDTVIVRRIGNQDWINAVGMNGPEPAESLAAVQRRLGPGGGGRSGEHDHHRRAHHLRHRETLGRGRSHEVRRPRAHREESAWRTSAACRNSIRRSAPKQYGNMDRPNYVAEEYYSDENHYSNFIIFDNIKHGWVRNVTALHFVYSMVGTRAGPSGSPCRTACPASRSPSGRAPEGLRSRCAGQLALVQRCHSDKGRHSFMTGQPTASDNVFLDCKATNPYSSSEPHEQWATGGLYDNIQRALDGPVLEEHQHRMGGREHGVLELRGDTSSFRSRRRRRTTRSDTSGSTRWCSTFRCRTRRRKTGISSRWIRT